MAKHSWKKVTRNVEFFEGLRCAYITPREDDPGNYDYWLGTIASIDGERITVQKDRRDEIVVLSRGDINYVNPDVTRELKEALEKYPVGSWIEFKHSFNRNVSRGQVVKIELSGHPPKHRRREDVNIWIGDGNSEDVKDLVDYGIGSSGCKITRIEKPA